ncbi:hypothetical protein Pint_05548 [Pistacia integerrima]|uniref:Uncharacterized protein n=1 Tax=Pistacia integerrima TaxID=434235 RepID=A0ACC0Z6V4_9ROSI|nr:hypothetical protein Pint_05548 [Pistacia integerrima]
MSARFNLCSEMIVSNSGDDNNEAYVEIVLDIFDDSVAINSINQGGAVHEDPELSSLINKITVENSSSSSVLFSLFQSTCSHIKEVFEELNIRISSLTKRPSASRCFDQTKSAAVHALKGLKLFG